MVVCMLLSLEVIFISTLVIKPCLSWSFIFDAFLFYFFETPQLQRDKVPSSWSPVYVGLQRWRRRGSKIENQSSSSLHTCTGSYKAAAANTHTGSNALQSSTRRLRVARAGASVYVVVQRCCRIKPLQGAAGKAPGALPLSVPVCASLLLYYCCPNPPPPPCVSAPLTL